MKLFPASLLGRNTLLLITLILLGQIFAGLLFRQFVQKPFVERLSTILANDLIAVQAGLSALPETQRQPFVEAYNIRDRALRDDTVDLEIILPAEKLLIRRTSAKLAKKGIKVIWRREAEEQYFAQFSVTNSSYWVSTSGMQRGNRLPRAALFSWLVGISLALAGAYLIQRRLNKPLRQLAIAADQVAKNEHIDALPEDGPDEIAKVCRRFNLMQRELLEQERQRALMLAGVSHDLRTPLTKIRLATEMLGCGSDEDNRDSIIRSCTQLDAIIDQFVDFAGVGNSEARARLELSALIREVVEDSQLDFTLSVELGHYVWLRPRAFKRALSNILENAHRYGAPEFGVVLRGEQDHVAVYVRDRGDGIDEDQAEALLKPFTRGNSARSGPLGAGLGLAIAWRIISMEQGELQLGNRQGGGLEVCISLPLP
ncbi:MAG: ATP-binding protein [Zhongshania sp.]|uniref:ATP-binding protein n=1 Tax=Zhongshania sp. TaxID=1971902 RepID=UPI0026305F94|nr:ATP-binding protein [Zhongshania sp.]MDF1692234.1 ATP-binding protein [Zhongshania sp.]